MILEEARREQTRQRGAPGGMQRSSLLEVQERTREFVTRQPVAAALIAIGLGYFVGRIAARR